MATTISVTGMSCDGCEDIVEGALEDVHGVESAEADQHENTATVEGDADVEDLVEAVDTAGYEGDTDPNANAEDDEAEEEADEADEADGEADDEADDEADEADDEATEE